MVKSREGGTAAAAAAVAGSLIFAAAGPVGAEEPGRWSYQPSLNDFGGTGLLQMPNGRMQPDGDFAVGASRVMPYSRYYLTSQFLPWMQATLRYTDIANRAYGITDKQSYKDKGIDVKFRLVEEGPYAPDISLGLRDIGGTGLFSTEYIAASRRYYDWDFTLGVAWGNAGSRGQLPNPFTYLADGFKQRGASNSTGTLSTSFFRGETVGLFGGIEYQTPIDGLKLKLEYDGNDYQSEPLSNRFSVASAVNAGVEYSPASWLTMGAAYERGNSVMFRLSLGSNLNEDMGLPKIAEPPPPPVAPRPAVTEQSPPAPSAPGPVVAMGGEDRADSAAENVVPSPAPSETAPSQVPAVSAAEIPPVRAEVAAEAPSEADRSTPDGRALFAELEAYGFHGQRYGIEHKTAVLVFSQDDYANTAKAIGRAARILANNAPPQVEQLKLILTEQDLTVSSVEFLRKDVERAARLAGSVDEAWLNGGVTQADVPEDVDWRAQDSHAPDFTWSVTPQMRQSVGGPDNFYLFQIYGALDSTVTLAPGVFVSGRLGANLYNNFDNFTYTAPSKMPRVRSNFREYMTTKEIWVDNLHADYLFDIAPDWYGRLSAGLFEFMYGGVGGEVLYRPSGKRWAIGLDLNHVYQRDYASTFGFNDYETTTGNLTWYQRLPVYDLTLATSIGRYLAGDVGATISLSRKFENGVQVGAWATKTDVSPHEFGEGSFDKGLFVTIPLDLFYTAPSKATTSFAFRPLIRDGGQKVSTPYPLYDVTTGGRDALQNGMKDTWK